MEHTLSLLFQKILIIYVFVQGIVHNHLMTQLISEMDAIANHSPDFANKIVVEGESLVPVFHA